MESFASGWKQHYYGKGDVVVYRLTRDGSAPAGRSPLFGANVMLLVYGDAFWPTYTTGDNTTLVATDSMKNFIQRETLAFEGSDLESLCRFLAAKFVETYPQAEGAQVSAREIPYARLAGGVGFYPAGPEHAVARVELTRDRMIEAMSGLHGFRLLRLGGSAFTGFVRDAYTTLPELTNRPLHMWLDVEWTYANPADACNDGHVVRQARQIVLDVFERFESGSIQQVIHQMGTALLAALPTITEIHLEANNRTWDTMAEAGEGLGVFSDPRPPYGCLGLRLKR